MNPLFMSCQYLKGIGPRLGSQLEKCGIRFVKDLLFHFPLRYQDRTRVTPISDVRVGDFVVIEGIVKSSQVKWGRKPTFTCQIADHTHRLPLKFFHFAQAQLEQFKQGVHIRCIGEISQYQNKLIMVHPEYKFLKEGDIHEIEESLTPIYPSTAGFPQYRWRSIIAKALEMLNESHFPDFLPEKIYEITNFPHLLQAIHYIHKPPPDAPQALLEEKMHPTQQRIIFEELLAHQLTRIRYRHAMKSLKGIPFNPNRNLINQFLNVLPYSLTNAQQRVLDEIFVDLASQEPMLRLIQGDVGSGKTVVATIAALSAIEMGYQVALMAPTEILAEQHYQFLSNMLKPLNISIAWLSGKVKGKERKNTYEAIANGDAQCIVGTHALFQEDVKFSKLSLVIIDEQHRFGVEERLALWHKGKIEDTVPHQLILTATPIPRTLSMSLYADLDTSIIDELPPGRTPIKTLVLPNSRRDEVIERIKHLNAQGRQVYWVCPFIETSEFFDLQAAEEAFIQLKSTLPDLKIHLIHGRMKAQDKESIMHAFKSGNIDLLVATTVIEVGVDVPNASLMVIENAERMGLSQLHQLRGRVGRGSFESFCVLLYQAPLSKIAQERLSILRDTVDGFKIARYDLKLRGPGEIFGKRQTGIAEMKVADYVKDEALLSPVQEAATILLNHYPEHVEPLINRWLDHGEKYANV